MHTNRVVLLGLLAAAIGSHAFAECSISGRVSVPAQVYKYSSGNVATAVPDYGVVVSRYFWSIRNGTITSTSADGKSVTFSVEGTGTGGSQVTLDVTMNYGDCYRSARTGAAELVDAPPSCPGMTTSTTLSAPAAASSRQLPVQASCDWHVSHLPWWITATTGSGTGNGAAVLSFLRNANANGRSALILVNEIEVNVAQQGVNSIYPDYNRDGKTDLLWRQTGGRGIVFTSYMNSTATNGGRWITTEPDPAWNAYAAGDHDGNGMSDLTWVRVGTANEYNYKFVQEGYGVQNKPGLTTTAELAGYDVETSYNATNLVYMHANGNLYFNQTDYSYLNYAGWDLIAIADVDGNLRTDLIFRDPTDGRLMVALLSDPWWGDPPTRVFHIEPNFQWQVVATGDVNGDGRADLIWRNMTDGRIWTMLMNGFSWTSGAVVWTEPDPHWVLKGTGDFNGDGRADLLFRNDLTGTVFVVLLNGNSVLSSGIAHYEPDMNWHLVGPTTTRAIRNRNSSLVP
jgi:hypothetical protein